MHTYRPIFSNPTSLSVDRRIVIVRLKEISLLSSYSMSMKYGVKNARRRRKRNGRVMSRVPVVSNVKDQSAFARVGREKMMWKLKDRDYCWMWMRRKKLVKVKQMGSLCMQDTSLLSWNELEVNFS